MYPMVENRGNFFSSGCKRRWIEVQTSFFSSSRSDTRVAACTQAQLNSQTSSKPGKTKKRRRVRTSGSRLAPQAEYVLTNVPSNHNTKKCASVSRASSCGPKYAAFHASAMSKYPQHPNAFNSSSKRVRIAVSYTHLTLPTICSV